jgi:hypothetical protein
MQLNRIIPADVEGVRVVDFKPSEWACRDKAKGLTGTYNDLPYCNGGIGKGIDPVLIKGLQLFRNHINKPVNITSGYRCPAYNKYVGGASRSQHLYGTAADIMVYGMTSEDMMRIIEAMDIFTGRGLYPGRGFIHVDTRRGLFGKPTRWVQIAGRDVTVSSFSKWLK